MLSPMVSVCIPVYNNERFLAEAIDSVLAQNYVDFEVLIIDDCSKDRTMEIAQIYASQDLRIRVLANSANLGMVHNWNRCIKLARGRYLKFLFGDDILTSPDTLGRMVEILERDHDVSLVASARTVIDEESRIVEILAGFADGARIPGKELVKRCLAGLINEHNPIGEPSVVMFRRDMAGRGFNPRYHQLVDVEMWFQLLEQGTFAYLGDPLCAFRRHGEQQTVKNLESLAYIDDMFYLLNDYLGRPYTEVGIFTKQYAVFQLAYIFWKQLGDRNVALRKICNHISPGKFFLQLVLYRLYVPIRNISRSIANRFWSFEVRG